MTKAKLKTGQIYYGPGEERRMILSIKGKVARVMAPLSMVETDMPVAEMEKFIKGSQRRVYRAPDGEIRITLKKAGGKVEYQTRDGRRGEVPQAEWDKWRAKVVD